MLYCGADIPQLSSAPTLNPNTSSIILSWLPTQLTPNSYRISYSCQLICGSSVTNQTVTVDGMSTTHILSAAPGSSCSVSVMAVFGTSILSNTVTSSTNTTSAGMYKTHDTCIAISNCAYVNGSSPAPTGAPVGFTSTSVERRSLSVVWGTVPCPHQSSLARYDPLPRINN